MASSNTVCDSCGEHFNSVFQTGCPVCQLKLGLASDHQTKPMPPHAISVEELSAKFEHLEVLELLGTGGMGAVYAARQKKLDRVVALKVVRPDISDSAEFAQRFEREAKALARLNHPNIVSIYDFGNVDGIFYYLMEYVDGTDLAELSRSEALSAEESLEIVSQVCKAIQFAHENDVVHRDIKPTNILLNSEGLVKIADFGLAKICSTSDESAQLTQTRQVFGTPRYMAPEQIESAKEVDHRADIYSLGVVFYELLTGELPLGRFDPPSQKIEVDIRLDEVVLRALEKHPERRYQAAREFYTDISQFSGVQPTPPVKPAHPSLPATNSTLETVEPHAPWYIAAMIIPAVLAISFGLYWGSNRSFRTTSIDAVGSFYESLSYMIWGVVLFVVPGIFVLDGALILWKKVRPEQWTNLKPMSPVRRIVSYRFGIYFSFMGFLVSTSFPWIAGFNGLNSTNYLGSDLWFMPTAVIIAFVFLAIVTFIDIYEGNSLYLAVAAFVAGIAIIAVLIPLIEGHSYTHRLVAGGKTLVGGRKIPIPGLNELAEYRTGFFMGMTFTAMLILLGAGGILRSAFIRIKEISEGPSRKFYNSAVESGGKAAAEGKDILVRAGATIVKKVKDINDADKS